MSASDIMLSLNQKSLDLLKQDASKIAKLIEVQMSTLTNRRCPLYEEVLDTQMYGLSREIDFAVRVGLVTPQAGKEILSTLERNLAQLYEALNSRSVEEEPNEA
ncbi:MAG TPA: YlaN family protein [Bacilli bacterium]